MKSVLLLLTCFILSVGTGKAQAIIDTNQQKSAVAKIDTNQFFDTNFNWEITIPPTFLKVSAEEWSRLQNKGSAAVEKTINHKIVNKSKTIFVFKKDQFNYFEANYQPFNVKTDGNYLKTNKLVNGILFNTMKNQIPKAIIDSASTITVIDKLNFNTFIIRIDLQNGFVLNMYEFTRLFGEKEFCVNVLFLNNSNSGDQMLNAWKSSTFGK